jgi:hypothetical protein
MTQDTSKVVGGNGKNAAVQGGDDEFKDYNLSLPQFRAGESEGMIQGYFINILGPFPPGKNQKRAPGEAAKPWFAYEVVLTAVADCIDANGKHVACKAGERVMLPLTAQLKSILPMVIDPAKVFNWRLTPGVQPKAGQMRMWKCQQGKLVERGDRFPRILPNSGNVLQLGMGEVDTDIDPGEGVPF